MYTSLFCGDSNIPTKTDLANKIEGSRGRFSDLGDTKHAICVAEKHGTILKNMIALQISLNGKQLCIAGTDDLCVLNSIVNAVGKLGDESNPQRDSNEAPDLFLSVGGLTGRKDSDDEHLRWTEHQVLSVGDEIIISMIEVNKADTPISRIPAKSVIEDNQRRSFEEAKKTYFALRDKFDSESTTPSENQIQDK